LGFTEKKTNQLLFATQAVGAVFVGIFLAAYLAGLPTTAVFHSELVFRIPLAIFGATLLILVLANLIVAFPRKK
jgi:hypothetical protein